MPVSHSRIGRSLSLGKTVLVSHMSPPIESSDIHMASPSASVKLPLKTPAVASVYQSWPKVVTPSYPLQEVFMRVIWRSLGDCWRIYCCKKKIVQEAEVFMYGNFHAFCTTKCRDMQISCTKHWRKVFNIRTSDG